MTFTPALLEHIWQVLLYLYIFSFASLSYVEGERIIQDIGLAAMQIFSVGIAIFVGIGLIDGAALHLQGETHVVALKSIDSAMLRPLPHVVARIGTESLSHV